MCDTRETRIWAFAFNHLHRRINIQDKTMKYEKLIVIFTNCKYNIQI